MSAGFVKLLRSDHTTDLLADRNAFVILTQIALRARYTHERSLDGLTFRQARIGDHEALGMSRGEYRSACRRLHAWGLASFQGVRSAKAGRRGTIATLLNSDVFSLTDERDSPNSNHHESHHVSHQIPEVKRRKGAINRATEATTERPPNDHRTTTNQNGQKEKNGQNVSSDLSATSADANADGASTVSSPQSEGRQSAGNRARPPLLDALAAVDGSNPREVTGPAWGGIAKALSAIKAAFPQVTPEEIARRAEAYRKLHPDWSLTPTALAKHWASCVPGAARYEGAARRPAPNIYVEPPNWREHAAAKWPGTELPEKWSDLSATLRNDLLNSRKQ